MKSTTWFALLSFIRMSSGSKKRFASWDLRELGRILDHPQLAQGSDNVLHTISFEKGRDRDSRKSISPKQRSQLNPREHVAEHRYVGYGRRRRAADIGKMANSMFRDEENENTHMSDRAGNVGNATLGNSGLIGSTIKSMPPSTTDDSHDKPPPITSDAPIYEPIRIHFDVSEIHQWREHDPERVDYLIAKVLPGLATVWSSALSVVPVASFLQIDYTWCPFGSPDNQAFTKGVQHSDLVVFVTANSAACDIGNILATASSCYWDQYQRPIAGSIDFCLETVETKHIVSSGHTTSRGHNNEVLQPEMDFTMQDPRHDRALQLSISAASYEFSHLLGVTPDDMLFFYDSNTGRLRTPEPEEREVECVSGSKEVVQLPEKGTLQVRKDKYGGTYYEVTLPTVTQVVRNHFDCQSLTGARLENQDDGRCFGSHFERRLFMGDGESPSILTPLTLALLQDSGWYLPNFRVAKVSPWGHGAGCDFVEQDCIEKGKATDFFCAEIANLENTTIEGKFGCDPNHMGIGVCDLVDYSELGDSVPPKRYQYFPDHPSWGAFMAKADYCPTYSIASVSCRDLSSSNEAVIPTLPEAVDSVESVSRHARCFPTVSEARPVCLNVICDPENWTVRIDVGADVVSCEQDGDTVDLFGVQIVCPPFAILCPELICPANCAGRGVCDFSSGKCHCRDQDDESKGCFDTSVAVPPQFVRGLPISSSGPSFPKLVLISWIIASVAGSGLVTWT